jgi:hypothetical protein
MVYNVLADPTRINDLYNVLVDPQVSLDLANLQTTLSTGKIRVTSTGPVALASTEPVTIDLVGTPATVTLVACVDKAATAVTYDGQPWAADRELAQYRVVKTTYLPFPGWAVAQVLPPPGFEETQTC